MKLFKATLATALVLFSASAIAWDMPWDNDRRDRGRWYNDHDNNFDMFDDIWGDMFGDMAGDFDFEIRVRANADGWGRGRGRGRGDNYWRGDQRYYGDHRYHGGRYRPYYGPYRHPGLYGGPPPLAPYGIAPRPYRPAYAAAPGPAVANRPPLARAPAPTTVKRATGTRPPARPDVPARSAGTAAESPVQQPPWALKRPSVPNYQ